MKQRKDRTVMVYFTDDEIDKVEKYAKKHKWSKGSAVRYIVDGFFRTYGGTDIGPADGHPGTHGPPGI